MDGAKGNHCYDRYLVGCVVTNLVATRYAGERLETEWSHPKRFTTTIRMDQVGGKWAIGPSVDWNDDGSVQVHGAKLRTVVCALFPTASGSWRPRAVRVLIDPLAESEHVL